MDQIKRDEFKRYLGWLFTYQIQGLYLLRIAYKERKRDKLNDNNKSPGDFV